MHGELGSAHVAGLLDHAFNGERAVVVRVGNGGASDVDAPWGGVDHRLGLDTARLQRQTNRERLHGRAGLEHVGERAVAQLLAGQVLALVGHVAGVVGQGQQLAGVGVHHHHAARLGLVQGHLVAQFLVGKELHLAVDGQLHVFSVDRWNGLAHAFDHAAQAVLDHAA